MSSMKKKCGKCKRRKLLSALSCRKKYDSQPEVRVRVRELGRIAALTRVKSDVAIAATKRAATAWIARNPDKHRAAVAVSHAIRDGRLYKGACEVCGTSDNVDGHHDDYTKPLDVRWLCRLHHKEHHRRVGT
jgi:hypothetical protein